MKTIDKNLSSLKQSVRAYNYITIVLSISHCACAYGNFRIAFSCFEAFLVCISAMLTRKYIIPINILIMCRICEKFSYFRHILFNANSL